MKKQDEFDERLGAAKREREAVKTELRELYLFLFNGREREWDKSRSKWTEPEEIFDTTAAEAALEFSSDLFSQMTPDTQPWVEYEVGSAVPEELYEDVKQVVEAREAHLANAIRSSNYYEVGPQIFQESPIGLVAAQVDRPSITSAIECEPVPISQLFITAGARGIEDRFRCKPVFARDIAYYFPDYKPSKAMQHKIDRHQHIECKWGYWPDWSDNRLVWKHMAKVEDEVAIPEMELGGPGSCPLLIGRFNPIPGTPYGRGPSWMLLPEIRTINALRQMVLNKMDQVIDPAIVYVRDGLLDLGGGLEAGMAYPAMPGAADEIREIGVEGNLDYGLFSLEELRRIIRRGHFRKEEQPGKTPPSATQFAGEEIDAMRRMGRPGASVFNEFVRGFLQRVEYLEVRDRQLDQQILVAGDAITVMPISPLVRSQAREAVVTAQSILQLGGQTIGPEGMQMEVDMSGTLKSIADKLGDELVRFRTPEQKQQILQAQQGAPAAAPGPAGG